ncbi:MAG: rhamnulokinase [Gaiellaceae bacterium]|nr:rhamnulokinase [Gaiellaceae bacterium]
MSGTVHVAFDLGAESGRAMAGRFSGDRVELTEVRRFPTRSVRLPDGLYWDALGLFGALTSALSEMRRSGAEIRSLGVDSWGVDFGLLDARGSLLGNPLSYRDGRGSAFVPQALERVPAEELYSTTGIQLLPFNTVFQLLALDAVSGLDRASTLLLVPDLLAYWLTGERHAEETNASTTQLLDARTGDWAWALIEQFGLPAGIFPPVARAGSMLGALLPHVAEATGLPQSTPVAAVASHDTASAVVAVPATSRDVAYISSGTWSLVGVELDEPVLSARAHAANLTNERGFGGTTRLLKNVMGLWLVQECRRAWLRDGDAPEYADLAALAAAAPSGALFDPDLPELLTPGDMPARIRAACARTGQEAPGERPALLRSIFESLACKYRSVLGEIESVTGRTIETVHVIGGGAQNEFLCRLTADVSRRVVLAGPVEAAALGNVLVQLHAFGEVASLAEMRAVVRSSAELRVYEPDSREDRWHELYGRFCAVLEAEVLTG